MSGTTWQYLFAVESGEIDEDGEVAQVWSLREVYMYPNGDLTWTEERTPAGESWKEVADDLALMGNAIGRQVLDLRDPEHPALRKPKEIR